MRESITFYLTFIFHLSNNKFTHYVFFYYLFKLVNHLPARTQGYPWRLVYSTAVHGTSLRTLYRNMACIDRPVLLVIKDTQNQVIIYLSLPFAQTELIIHSFRMTNR